MCKMGERNDRVVAITAAMPDGTYIVRLAGSPFFPSPLAETKSYETAEAVVAGCVAQDGRKEVAK